MRVRKCLKHLAVAAAIALIAATVIGVIAWRKYRATPQWYVAAPPPLLPGERDPAEVLQDQVIELQNRAANPAERELAPPPLIVTERQLNATLHKWRSQVSNSTGVNGAMIRLTDNGLLLAAESGEAGGVVSLSGVPRLNDEGMLVLDDQSLHIGTLWVPQRLVNPIRRELANQLRSQARKMKPRGRTEGSRVSGSAAAANSLEQAAALLSNQPAEPVIHVPAGPSWYLPMRIERLELGDGTLEIHLVPIDASEPAALNAAVAWIATAMIE